MNRKTIVSLTFSAFIVTGCVTPGKRTAVGGVGGAAAGAAAGAAIGAAAGNAGKGAWIGAAAGAVLGTAIGNKMDKQARELEVLAETQRTENGIITTMRENLLFDSGKSVLKPSAKDSVNAIADIIKNYPEDHIIVVGHTDNVGSDSYNQQLSEQRARAVRLQMVERGVPATSIEAMGQGETSPVADNGTVAGRAKNRRVELQISVDPSKVK